LYLLSLDPEDGDQWTRILDTIQARGTCCGFDPPNACYFKDIDKCPFHPVSERTGENYPDVIALPRLCGKITPFFASTDACNIWEVRGNVKRSMGCAYYLPAGKCKNLNFRNGCALEAQNWINGQITPKLQHASNLTIINIIASTFAGILLLKRKDDDVLPTEFVRVQALKHQNGPRLLGTAFSKKRNT